jgi:hypothetical protein
MTQQKKSETVHYGMIVLQLLVVGLTSWLINTVQNHDRTLAAVVQRLDNYKETQDEIKERLNRPTGRAEVTMPASTTYVYTEKTATK